MLGKSQAKYIQSLGQKKVRDAEGVFVAEGPKIIAELLASANANILQLYALHDWIAANRNDCNGVEIIEVDENDLTKISQLATPNKVLAVVKKQETADHLQTKGTVSLVLETIQDPGNLGTIIRIADWFGIEHVVCSRECVDIYNPKVVQAAMGGHIRISFYETDLLPYISALTIPVLAATLNGDSLYSFNSFDKAVLLIGNESKGLSEELIVKASHKITIPRRGGAESLNAAVSAGILCAALVPH